LTRSIPGWLNPFPLFKFVVTIFRVHLEYVRP
jgi:hypothetical protein